MPLYELTSESILPVEAVGFASAGVKERSDLQRLLREKIDVVSPGTLVIAEEFGQWADSRRRIDLLGVDSAGNLVVIELKRTEDGGHMDLQAIRYAAMISTLTFEQVADILRDHLVKRGSETDARTLLLSHLGWESQDDGEFAEAVRMVLVAADFSKEITTSVLWLNEQGLDIRCVRLSPYQLQNRILVDVQQVIPLPEASEYTVQIREKRQETQRARRIQQRDFSKFILTFGSHRTEALNKRRTMLEVFRFLIGKGISPESIVAPFPAGARTQRCEIFPGRLSAADLPAAFARVRSEGRLIDYSRYFVEDDEILHGPDFTCVVTKMWGIHTKECLESIVEAHPEYAIRFETVEE